MGFLHRVSQPIQIKKNAMERFNIGWWCAKGLRLDTARLLPFHLPVKMSVDTKATSWFGRRELKIRKGYPERRGHDNSRGNSERDGDGPTCPIPNPNLAIWAGCVGQ